MVMRLCGRGNSWFLERGKDSIVKGQRLGFFATLGEERKVHGGYRFMGDKFVYASTRL